MGHTSGRAFSPAFEYTTGIAPGRYRKAVDGEKASFDAAPGERAVTAGIQDRLSS
ncbi:hypothetical protein K8353_37855 [Burkholderia contaminans]|nr:hypothetical protein [Burkholderia contaminans]